jgi:outer membrane lipoprotein-sorting protein
VKLLQTTPTFLSYFLLIIFIWFLGVQKTNSAEKTNSILKVENFFKNLKTLEANFIQVSPSGKTSEGKIFLDLPGKLRIDYNQPNNILITTKGFWIVIQNRELKNKINVNNKDLILELKKKLGIIELKVKLSKNKQAGELILEFSEKPFILKKWIIGNVVGDETTVLIQNAKYNQKLPFTIFFPDDFPEPIN